MKNPEVFTSNKLHFRLPQIEDAEAIFEAYAQDLEVCKYLTWAPYTNLEDYQTWLSDKINDIGVNSLTYVIYPKDSPGEIIGMIDAHIDNHTAEVGYAIKQSEWGKGYMTETLTWMINLLLAKKDIYRVFAVCDLDNPASARVMKKSGMLYEGLLKRYIVHPNISKEPRDVLCYAASK